MAAALILGEAVCGARVRDGDVRCADICVGVGIEGRGVGRCGAFSLVWTQIGQADLLDSTTAWCRRISGKIACNSLQICFSRDTVMGGVGHYW